VFYAKHQDLFIKSITKQNSNMKSNFKKLIGQNLSSGLVVFLVALPLCLGIALASGATPLSGIISGIIGGIVVGTLSNSNISVSGPAAGLTAIVLAGITDLGGFNIFLCAGMVAGLLQLLMGYLKAGSISNYFPLNVIEGMLAGIGVIIILKQIPHALGYDKDYEGAESIAWSNLLHPVDFFTHLWAAISPGAMLIALISLAILIFWENNKTLKKIKSIPPALVAVVASIFLNKIFQGGELEIAQEHLVSLPQPKTLGELSALLVLPDFASFGNYKVWLTGFTIAVVASIETLLCIEASDRLDVQRRITNTNRELKAQGIGNLLSSLLGGLPMTSVVVRSSANANAGATHKTSTIIHGIFLLLAVLAIPFVLNMIPLATLAAVLLVVGYKLANPKHLLHFWHKGYSQFIPFLLTIVAVVATDLLKGVGIGLFCSVVYILIGNMKRAYFISKDELAGVESVRMTLAQEVSFLNKAAVKETLMNLPERSHIVIDASKTSYISTDVLVLIEEFANIQAKHKHIKVELVGFRTKKDMDSHYQSEFIKVKHRKAI
jgi:MFS superfamily sulfate permease-like transporter